MAMVLEMASAVRQAQVEASSSQNFFGAEGALADTALAVLIPIEATDRDHDIRETTTCTWPDCALLEAL